MESNSIYNKIWNFSFIGDMSADDKIQELVRRIRMAEKQTEQGLSSVSDDYIKQQIRQLIAIERTNNGK